MRQTFTTNFYCRSSKADRNGQSPVEMSIIINGARTFIQLPYRTTPGEFKSLTASTKSNELKDYIEEVRAMVRSVQIDMMRNGIPFTATNLKSYFITGGVKTHTVKSVFDEYYRILEKRVGKTLTLASYKKYQTARDIFYRFHPKESEITTVSPGVMQSFLVSCQSQYEDSTTCGMMTKIKTVFKFAMDNGYLTTNPFINLRWKKGRKEIEYLTESEMASIKALRTPIERLERVRDIMIFMMSSGLAYIDFSTLKKEDYKFTPEGVCYIEKNRHKTGTKYTAVIFPEGVEVLKKYNFRLPVMSNQKLNSYMKEIQDLCGIRKNLHCHLCRKSYATRLLNSGVRLETVSRSLGHSSTAITQQAYASLLNNTVVDEVSKIF